MTSSKLFARLSAIVILTVFSGQIFAASASSSASSSSSGVSASSSSSGNSAAGSYAYSSSSGYAYSNSWGGGGGGGGSVPVCKTKVISETKSGPANYHETYAKISQTLVTIENYKLRLENGSTVFVASAPTEVNLQDLSAFSKGLRLDLSNADFPGGAQSIDVAEIEVDVRQADNRLISTDGTTCKLSSIPGRLNFYTSAPITLVKDAYHVKVNFTALNAIQLHVITKVTQTECCQRKKGCNDMTCVTGAEKTEVTNQCKLVNRRSPITTIPLAVDDDF